jgi:hypothetical protein
LGYVEYIVPGSKPGDPNPLGPRNRLRGAIRGLLGRGDGGRPDAAKRGLGDTLFRQLDTDNDGSVSRDEVKAKYANNPAASTVIFDRLDSDNNDALSQEELRKLAEVLRR